MGCEVFVLLRKNLENLKSWYHSKHRKPMILRGARQVGKSTLVQQFAQVNNLNLLEFNFETIQFESLKNKTIKLDDIIQEIQLNIGRSIRPATDLIFFDEIQKSPQALMSLRYFFENRKDLAVIAAGSLLDFLLTEEDISMPVGRVEFHFLGPLQFSEFLAATQPYLFEIWQNSFDKVTEVVHKKLLECWHQFLVIGGMPEAVSRFIENKDFLEVRKIHRNIAMTYKADFLKYAKRSQVHRCDTVFDYVPTALGEKVKYSQIDSNEKSMELKKAVDLLTMAHVILKCKHSNASSVPISATSDDRIYKVYSLDVGLMSSMMEIPPLKIINHDHALKGGIMEQAIAQHLAYYSPYEEPHIYYWLKDKNTQKAEVDFICAYEDQILPIEVKSSPSAKSKSLAVFCETHPQCKNVIQFSNSMVQKKQTEYGTKLHIPYYFIEKWADHFKIMRMHSP